MDTILKAENLNVYYGSIHAIKDVSIEMCIRDRRYATDPLLR